MPLHYALVCRQRTVLAEHTALTGNFATVTRILLAKIPSNIPNNRMSYVYDEYVFHYMISDRSGCCT